MHAGPEAFLSGGAAQDDCLELFSDVAVSEWPRNPSGRKALAKLAELLKSTREDLWLSDLISAPMDGLPQLAAAMEANSSGGYSEAFSKAAESVERFRRAGNRAGILRAEQERVYALQRMLKGNECLDGAKRLWNDVRPLPYRALRIQAGLELASCWNGVGRIGPALAVSEQALTEARAARYRSLEMRAVAIVSALQVDLGDATAIYGPSLTAVEDFWNSPSPPIRAQFLLVNLALAAEQDERLLASYAMRKEAVSLIKDSNDRLLAALSFSRLGSMAERLRYRKEVLDDYTQAERLFTHLPPTTIVRDSLIYARMGRATALAEGGNRRAALRILEGVRDESREMPTPFMTAELHTELGRLYEQLGDARARDEFEQAISFNKAQPDAVRTRGAILVGLAEATEAYRGLASVLARQGQWTEALQTWEQRNGPAERLAGGTRAPFLIYAPLGKQMAVWIVQNQMVRGQWLDISADELNRKAARFERLCADPNSPAAAWKAAARGLYDALIRPVEPMLPASSVLIVEPDGPLLQIPLSALLGNDGQFLGDRFTIVLTDSLAGYAHRADASATISRTERALAIADPVLRGEMRRAYPPLPYADLEIAGISREFPKVRVLEGSTATLANVSRWRGEASVFHFAGHGFTTNGTGGLLLASADADSEAEVLDSKTVAQEDWSHYQLVVLSACLTGVERIGVGHAESLARSFLRAGAKRVIAARWSVDSELTAELMQDFYTGLGRGVTPALALRDAEAAMRKGREHPYFWAALDLYGAP